MARQVVAIYRLTKHGTERLYAHCSCCLRERGCRLVKLNTEVDVTALFDEQFADAKALMPGLLEDFFTNPAFCRRSLHIFIHGIIKTRAR